MDRCSPRAGAYEEVVMGMFAKKPPKFRPLNDRILVRPEVAPGEKVLAKGPMGEIIAAGTKIEADPRGEVLVVGPGAVNQHTGVRTPIDLKVGDIVKYGKHAGQDIKVGEETLLMLRESDVFGVDG